jgi:hypothetical protein
MARSYWPKASEGPKRMSLAALVVILLMTLVCQAGAKSAFAANSVENHFQQRLDTRVRPHGNQRGANSRYQGGRSSE